MGYPADSLSRLRSMTDLLTPMTIRVAATLRVADHVAAGYRTASHMAHLTGIEADRLDRVLQQLVTLGVLEQDQNDEYTLTSLGELLRDDHSDSMRDALDIEAALGRAELSFVRLLDALRTGHSSYSHLYGQHLWEDLTANPRLRSSYDEQMSSDVSSWAPGIIDTLDWTAFDRVIDVGGGDGTLLIELLKAVPSLHGTIFDLPETAETARRKLEDSGLRARGDAIGGNFFEPLPTGYDAYLLTAIIHDWDDDEALTILQRCREAAAPDGQVIVIEKIGTDGETPNTAMDLRLLAYLNGRERSLRDLTALCERAGLTPNEIQHAGSIALLRLGIPS